MELGREFDSVDVAAVFTMNKMREKMSKEQYERYTHSYMKVLTNKMMEGSKCKLNGHAKALLQDARKMRDIIDFSKK